MTHDFQIHLLYFADSVAGGSYIDCYRYVGGHRYPCYEKKTKTCFKRHIPAGFESGHCYGNCFYAVFVAIGLKLGFTSMLIAI